MQRRSIVLPLTLALAACGGTSTSGTSSTGTPGSTADVQAYSARTQQISGALQSYEGATASMPNLATCSSDEATYDAQVRPMLQAMRDMSGAMDARMDAIGEGADADLACAANAMLAELDRHAPIACASPVEMGPNVAEANRHAQVMTAWLQHQQVRTGMMGTALGMGMMGASANATTGTCQQNADGTYTLTGGAATPTVDATTVQAFATSAQDIVNAATAYGNAAAAMPDVAACTTDETGYEVQVRPMLDQMRATSDAMDARLTSLGAAASADLTCVADAMRAELARHAAIACSSRTDMGPNRTEAARHVQAMTGLAEHQELRVGAMGSMMGIAGTMGASGMMGTTSGAVATCQRNPDGSFTISDASTTTGGTATTMTIPAPTAGTTP